ncbi:MAG: hypothetical protein DSY47_01865 [Hydrogenothermus sp.]|nr:MAG: hypothetical protein DSY47_01865 [Hydrogenothermus sp.]
MKKYIIAILLLFNFYVYSQDYISYTPSQFTNPFAQPQFVPNISLIADFSYVSRDIRDETYESLEIPAFLHQLIHKHGEHKHAPMNANRGFNLNYAELSLESAVDPYINLMGIFHITEGAFEIEELYFTTRSLPYNIQVKGGKFLSSIGRINSQHQHYWDFVDIPLIYKVLFGDEGLSEKGVQLTWIAPAPFYLLMGTELFQGENEYSFGYESIENNGKIIFYKAPVPNLYTAFVKTSYDIGNLTFLGGFSYLSGKTRFNHLEDQEEPHAFGGNTKIYGFDIFAKYFIDSYKYISFQGEYFYRNLDGFIYKNMNLSNLEKRQGGFYIQTIYRFSQRWRLGFRYDLLNKNEVNGEKITEDLDRYSLMIDFTPSEWTRIRFQYNYDRSKFIEDERKEINEFILEINFAIGAHGAHKF